MHLSCRNCRHLATWKMSFDQFALYDRVACVGSGSRSGCANLPNEFESRFTSFFFLLFFLSSFFQGMTLEIIALVFTILSRLSVDLIIDFELIDAEIHFLLTIY